MAAAAGASISASSTLLSSTGNPAAFQAGMPPFSTATLKAHYGFSNGPFLEQQKVSSPNASANQRIVGTSNGPFHAQQKASNPNAGAKQLAEAAKAIAFSCANAVTGRMLHAQQGQELLEVGLRRHHAPRHVPGGITCLPAQHALLQCSWHGSPKVEFPT